MILKGEEYLKYMAGQRDEQEAVMARIDGFCHKYNQYYTGELSAEQMQKETTQVYCQSLGLGRCKMEKHGLSMEVEYIRRPRKDSEVLRYSGTRLRENEDYRNVTTEAEEQITARRIFYKGGRKIYAKKRQEICHMDFLSSAVAGDEVQCPNCGAPAKLAEYLDGCDYCGAKFEVHELEEKVSGYSFREDVGRRTTEFLQNINKGIAIFLMVMPFVNVLLIMAMTTSQSFGHIRLSDTLTLIWAMSIVMALPLAVTTGIALILAKRYVNKVSEDNGARVTMGNHQTILPTDFPMNDFAQNLDWKLKSLFLDGKGNQGKSFVKCSTDELVKRNAQAVDCSLTRLNLTAFTERQERYELEAEAHVRLYKFETDRIKDVTERYALKMQCKRTVEERKIAAIRQYKCAGCGSSVDVLGIGVCSHCEKPVDYSQIGWEITDLQYLGVKKSGYVKHICKILKYYLIGLAIALSFAVMLNSDTLTNYFGGNLIKECVAHMDEKLALHEVVPEDVVLVETEVGFYTDRRMDYELSLNTKLSAEEIVLKYKEYLESQQYTCHTGYTYEGQIYMIKGGMLDGEFGDYICQITYREGAIGVYECFEKAYTEEDG